MWNVAIWRQLNMTSEQFLCQSDDAHINRWPQKWVHPWVKMSKLGQISHFLTPVSCDSLVLQGLRCEWGAGVLKLVLSLSLSHTGHWKFNMAPHGKELSEDLKNRIIALHKDGVGYKKIAKTLKLSCSTVAETIQRFNRTGSPQNRPRHGRPKKLSARAQRHMFGKYMYECCQHCCRGWMGGGSACQCSDHTPQTASNWSAWLSSQKEASSKDDAQENPLTVCWRQAD